MERNRKSKVTMEDVKGQGVHVEGKQSEQVGRGKQLKGRGVEERQG